MDPVVPFARTPAPPRPLHDLWTSMAEELSVTSWQTLAKVTGAGAKYSLTGAIFALTIDAGVAYIKRS